MEASSPFTFALIGLAVGFVIGLVCYRLFSKGARDVASLKQTMLEREHQIADLKKGMSHHLTGIQQRQVDGAVGRGTGVRLDVGVIGAEQFLGTVDG